MIEDRTLAEEIRREINKEIIRDLWKTWRLERTSVDEDGNVIEPEEDLDLDWLL